MWRGWSQVTGNVANNGKSQYLQDAEGNRVAKDAITSMSYDLLVNGFSAQYDYVRDQSGNQLSEFTLSNVSPVLVHTHVYANGTLMATYDT